MTDLDIRHGDWDSLKARAAPIRYQVFVEEQHVPLADEWDGRDADCLHFLVSVADGTPIATARLLPDGHIGRMAVLADWRGRGIGLHLLEDVIAVAGEQGHEELLLNAQTHAIAFYQKAGFEVFGEQFMDAGLPHRAMRRRIQR